MKLKKGFSPITETPPDEEVIILYENGKIGKAFPTYYPFKFVEGKIVDCENHWDGGWMIDVGFKTHRDNGKIIGWKKWKQ